MLTRDTTEPFDTHQIKSPRLRTSRTRQVILEPIVFIEWVFKSTEEQTQYYSTFLEIHPENGKGVRRVVDNEKDAEKELGGDFNYEVDALIAAKQLDMLELERIGRVVLGKDVTRMSTAELKRDVLVYARKSPKDFLSTLNDPMTNVKASVALMFDKGLLGYRGGKDVHFNLPNNKKRMLTVPYGEEIETT
jgi:hypothetical protein